MEHLITEAYTVKDGADGSLRPVKTDAAEQILKKCPSLMVSIHSTLCALILLCALMPTHLIQQHSINKP